MKAIYNPKLKAIPCKDGAYRRLCDMTPTQLAEEGYDEMGERLPKLYDDDTKLARFAWCSTCKSGCWWMGEYYKCGRIAGAELEQWLFENKKPLNVGRCASDIKSSCPYWEPIKEVKKLSDADFNKPRQLHNCKNCKYEWSECRTMLTGANNWLLTVLRNECVDAATREDIIRWEADNCPGWKEKE